VAIGQTSAPRTFNIRNYETVALPIIITSTNTEFAETGCGPSLAPGALCTASVTFTPAANASGVQTGQIQVAFSGVGSPASLSVTGTAVPPITKTITSLSVSAPSTSIHPLGTDQFTATATYSDGTKGTVAATFASSNTGVATISSSTGLATGVISVAGGTTNITAATGGFTSPPFLLTVQGVSVAVTPANPTFPLGLANAALPFGPTNNSVPFAATATYTDGTTGSVAVTWNSTAGTVATINSSTGAATVLTQGSTTISATFGPVAGTALLTVQPPILESVAVCLGAYPSAFCGTSTASVGATLGLNATQQFSAQGIYSDGSIQNLTNTATWAAHDPLQVNVNATGLATVLATDNNAHAVTASYGTVAAYLNSDTGWITASKTAPVSCPAPTIDMKVLVVNNSAANAGAGYADFPAVRQVLNYVGTPYDVVDVTSAAPTLSDGACHGYYQGVIFAYGGDFYNISGWQSTLISYEQTFQVRQVNWFDFPDPNFGLSAYAGNQIPSSGTYSASFTSAAAPIFFYANVSTPVAFSGAQIYLVPPSNAQGTATPLLTDSSGNALSVVITYTDGRQYLTNTFDSNANLTHNLTLAYGLLNWVTKGIFLGDYHVYASPQVDDFFINDSEWIPSTTCLTNPITQDRTPPDAANLPVFRINSADMSQLVAWQTAKQADPLLSQFKLTLAFNGVGTAGNGAWTGLTGAITATSSANGLATFTATGLSALPGEQVTVAGTTNVGGALNGTWTILSVASNTLTTPGTTQFTANVTYTGTAPTTTETGATASIPDDLVANLQNYQAAFHWISHTYDHPNTLNGLTKSGPPDPNGDDIDLEVLTNLWVASSSGGINLDTDPSDINLKQLTFTDFNPANMVTPGITGLNDTTGVPGYLNADGIKFVVTDSSVIGQPNNGPNPSPNVGIVNSYAPGIYEVPRYPNDIFYNAANWADDQAEFVCIYSHYVPPGSPPGTVPAPDPPFDTFDAAQILDFTSSIFVTNMLKGDMDPQMFHQPDLHFSDNYTSLSVAPVPPSLTGLASPHVSALITDAYDQTFSKYKALFNLPVLSPTLDQLGGLMRNRNSFNLSGVTASIVGAGTPTATINLTVPATAPASAVIPLTGLTSTGSEVYGGQNISHITMAPGQTITLPAH
jgi:hypothetical protein